MDELIGEIRQLSQRVRTLTLVVGFVTIVLASVLVGTLTAAGRAGPRLVGLRERNDHLLAENNRLRAELEATKR